MGRVFTQKISKDELADKIWDVWKRHEDYELCSEDYEDYPDKGKEVGPSLVDDDYSMIPYYALTDQVVKDLYKVDFDSENVMVDPEFYRRRDEMNYADYVGLHTLDNGLSYLGVLQGGDWEIPVFFILYWDGSKLRGYVPEEGNLWNTNTKKAYGNDPYSDEINFKQRGFSSEEDAEYDFRLIEKDIKKRIVYKE